MGQRCSQTARATAVNGRPRRQGNRRRGNATRDGTARNVTGQIRACEARSLSCTAKPLPRSTHLLRKSIQTGETDESRSRRRRSVSVAACAPVARPVFCPRCGRPIESSLNHNELALLSLPFRPHSQTVLPNPLEIRVTPLHHLGLHQVPCDVHQSTRIQRGTMSVIRDTAPCALRGVERHRVSLNAR